MSAAPASPGPFPSEQKALQAVLRRRSEALPSLGIDLFGPWSKGRAAPRSTFGLLAVLDDQTLGVDDASYAPLLRLGSRHLPAQRSERRNTLAAPTKAFSRRLRTGSDARPASSARAARQRPARGAWLRHRVFSDHRLTYCTSHDHLKSCRVNNTGRCPKMLRVNDVTHKPQGLPWHPSRLAMHHVVDAFDRWLCPLLAPKMMKTRGLWPIPGLSPGCYPTDCDAESDVRLMNMTDHPFQESPDALVSICRHLVNESSLHWVHHLPAEPCVWNLMCTDEHQRSDIVQITLAEAYRLFPEIKELADVPQNMEVSFKKGKTSGKWYDFHPGK